MSDPIGKSLPKVGIMDVLDVFVYSRLVESKDLYIASRAMRTLLKILNEKGHVLPKFTLQQFEKIKDRSGALGVGDVYYAATDAIAKLEPDFTRKKILTVIAPS